MQVRAQAEEAEKERAARDVAYRADTAKESLRLWEQQEAARKVRDWGGGRGRREEAANRHGQWGREGLCKWGSPGGVAILLYFPLPCSHIHIHIFLFPACFLLQAFEAQNSLMGEELSRRTEVEVW